MDKEEQIIRTEYSEVMQQSYIDYAMSVIIARALPDVRDGLSRFSGGHYMICMNWGIKYDRPYRKCAVLWAIQWVNTIPTVILRFMKRLW